MELPLPEQRFLAAVVGHRGPKSLTRAVADQELVAALSTTLEGWCSAVEAALAEGRVAVLDRAYAAAAQVRQGTGDCRACACCAVVFKTSFY